MSKEVEHNNCSFCESVYKLSYNLQETSGHPKFCPFCGTEVYEDEEDEGNYKDEE